jgi:hypothetical protein
MPEDIDGGYGELVRLAYLVLPGRQKRIYRLAMARRIVDQTLPRRAGRAAGSGSARIRTRVLRRAIGPSWRLRVMLGPWLRALPPRLPDPALTVALARLDPAARAAYVLTRVESRPRHQTRDQLVAAGVRNARAALEAADAVPDVTPPGLDSIVGPAVRRRSRLPIAAATALTVVLSCGLVMTRTDGAAGPEAHRPRLTMAADGAWKTAPHSLDVWPARGELTRDPAFTARALAAWARQTGNRHDPQLLFAGQVGGSAVALLRQGDRISRYGGARGAVEVFPAGDASSPLALGQGRYLLAPWTTRVTETKSDTAVTDHDGVTDAVKAAGDCGRGPLLRLRQPDGTRTAADLGGLALADIVARPESGATGAGTSEVRLWERLACVLPAPARAASSATAWEFWSGLLPGGTRGRFICTRYAYPGGGTTAYGTLLTGTDKAYAAGDCGPQSDGAVSGTWWRSAGRWYYVAAASKGLTPQVAGPSGRPRVRGRLLVVRAGTGAGTGASPPEGAVVVAAVPRA